MQMDDPTDQTAASDEDADAELMHAMGVEIRAYVAEELQILLARIDARLDQQAAILDAIKRLEIAMTAAMTAPRMIVSDQNGKAIGVRSVLSS